MHKDESDVVRPWWSTTVLVVEDSSIIADGDCRHSVAVTLTVQIDRTLEVVSIDVWTECRLQSSVRIMVTGAETLPIGTTKVDTSQVYIILLMIMLLDRSVDERHAPVSTQIDANSDGGSRLVGTFYNDLYPLRVHTDMSCSCGLCRQRPWLEGGYTYDR